ncbi:hypothetical protein EV143_101512 [Flavobacterium chryseum]|uniref:hypothetical protein n=1 Tax=Flavobacterium sp. P3160 TaxID=2512113 RepID=UPI0010614BAA|nr:hypothetical protein [Flavobacterium sp. P3160]TDO84067.1 hypothetical protein EV143_101512 [Flavobacterium sp. P3160]
MKKAALTIGLLSLVVVTTSFTTPQTLNNTSNEGLRIISNEELNIVPPIEGTGMGRRKADFTENQKQFDLNYKQSGSFTTESQSTRMNVKFD